MILPLPPAPPVPPCSISLSGPYHAFELNDLPRRRADPGAGARESLNLIGGNELMRSGPIRLAVCISGGGTTLRNLLERIAAGGLGAEVAVVIASRPGIGGIAIAEGAGIPAPVISKKGKTVEAFSDEVFAAIRAAGSELVVLGGFLSLLRIPEDFEGRVINIHPSLIPAFCGAGMHGGEVHRAVLERGAKLSGCTVHFADNAYDAGPIILQRAVPVLDDDTPESLAARVFAEECEALPEAIRLFAEGRLRIEGSRVRVASEGPNP